MFRYTALGVALAVSLSACGSDSAAVDAVKNLKPHPNYIESNMAEIMAGREFCQDGEWRQLSADNDGALVEFRCTMVGGASLLNTRHSPNDPFSTLEDTVVWRVDGNEIEVHSATLYVTHDSGTVREIDISRPELLLSDIIDKEHLQPELIPNVIELIAFRSMNLIFQG